MGNLMKNQVKTFSKVIEFDGRKRLFEVNARYDDQCGNGHHTFSITGDIHRVVHPNLSQRGNPLVCGCVHDEIKEHFPELAHMIKWHLTSSDGPMYYIANTTYHASDKDHNGLREGEKRQIVNGRSGLPSWELATLGGEPCTSDGIPRYVDSAEKPEDPDHGWLGLQYIPWCHVGEGKEPNIEAARSCAVWPDATLEQLQDVDALKARLPALLADFRKDVTELGLVWE